MDHNLNYISEASSHATINALRLFVHVYPPSCIAKYSFILLPELNQCRVNELAPDSTRQYRMIQTQVPLVQYSSHLATVSLFTVITKKRCVTNNTCYVCGFSLSKAFSLLRLNDNMPSYHSSWKHAVSELFQMRGCCIRPRIRLESYYKLKTKSRTDISRSSSPPLPSLRYLFSLSVALLSTYPAPIFKK